MKRACIIGWPVSHSLSPVIHGYWLQEHGLEGEYLKAAVEPEKFEGFPKEMSLRPSQIRASSAESALMIPDAFQYAADYANLKMPVVIVAGDNDRVVDTNTQSARLHSDVPQSKLHRIAGHGHMIHQTATDKVTAAIDEASRDGSIDGDSAQPPASSAEQVVPNTASERSKTNDEPLAEEEPVYEHVA